MVRVKICGITNLRDAHFAADAGADALGLIFAKSPRKVSRDVVRKIVCEIGPRVMSVGVFVDESVDRMLKTAEICALDAVQLHGKESDGTIRRLQKDGYRVLKAVRAEKGIDLKKINESSADALLFDASVSGRFGGTGQVFNWKLLKDRKMRLPWFVSGGLTADNVKKLLAFLDAYGVDVSSGVEKAPGQKNEKLVKGFIRNAKLAG